MDSQIFRRLIGLAKRQLAQVIQEKQDQLLRIEKFGLDKACIHQEFYHPGKTAQNKDMFGDIQEELDRDVELYEKLEAGLDSMNAAEWEQIVGSI